jgi:GGDEF domain-containing protein
LTRSGDEAIEYARRAIDGLATAVDLREPLAGFLWGASRSRDRARREALIAHVAGRTAGHIRSDARYRWELSHRVGAPEPAYAPASGWAPWRAGDTSAFENDPYRMESALLLPVVCVGYLELLHAAAHDGSSSEKASLAASLFDESLAVLRYDLARAVVGDDPFSDTHLLRVIARSPHVLARLEPLAVALASTYAVEHPRPPVEGVRFPFVGKPLASATAMLASALLDLGLHLPLLADQVAWLAQARRDDGGWADAAETSSDVLTTTMVASVLVRLDPEVDGAGISRFLIDRQGEDGLWRALGPDAPWITAEVVELLEALALPFSARFRWPHVHASHRDRKTLLPSFGHFLELCELFGSVGSLARTTAELGFVDLIGFRAFNNLHGQDLGDDILAAFGEALSAIPGVRTIRDGGDEFLVVGAPTRDDLQSELEAFLDRWRAIFVARYGETTPVAPRVLVARGSAGELRRTRESLGRAITETKTLDVDPTRGFVMRARPTIPPSA